jgi:hypothetical protein
MLFDIKHKKKKTLFPSFTGGFSNSITWSPEVTLYFSRFVVNPPLDVMTKLAAFIDGLVAAGVYAKIDEMWMLANNNSTNARLGIKNKKDITVIGAPVFTINRGYTGNFLNTDCLNTNFIPSIDGVNFTLNNGSLGVYSRTSQASSRVDIGGQAAASNCSGLMSGNTTVANSRVAISQNGYAGNTITAGADTLGMQIISRTDNLNLRLYKGGLFFNVTFLVNSGLTDKNIYILANNNNGVIASSCQKELSFAFIGGTLTDANMSTIASSIEVYLDYIGAGVMP